MKSEKDPIKLLMELGLINSIPNSDKNFGIPESDYDYHIVSSTMSLRREVCITQEFLIELLEEAKKQLGFEYDFDFMNYGDTELVYIVTTDKEKYTALVNQPITPIGVVKLEYENLCKLSKENPHVVIKPILYHGNEEREGYLTPYIKQARCIGSNFNGYGDHRPDPFYHFEVFDPETEKMVLTMMVANLIRLYNEEEHLAIAECRLGGGDFVMEREYDEIPHTLENTEKHMKLLSARKLINIDLKDYIALLRKELTKYTYYRIIEDRNDSIIVNQKNRMPIDPHIIEEGIKVGLALRQHK